MSNKPRPKTERNMSGKSEEVFGVRFLMEYETIIQNIFYGRKQKKLDYMVMCEIMERMGFIKSSQKLDSPNFIHERTLMFDLWLVLKGDKFNGVTKRNLLVFLFAIVGLNFQIVNYGTGDNKIETEDLENNDVEKETEDKKLLSTSN